VGDFGGGRGGAFCGSEGLALSMRLAGRKSEKVALRECLFPDLGVALEYDGGGLEALLWLRDDEMRVELEYDVGEFGALLWLRDGVWDAGWTRSSAKKTGRSYACRVSLRPGPSFGFT